MELSKKELQRRIRLANSAIIRLGAEVASRKKLIKILKAQLKAAK